MLVFEPQYSLCSSSPLDGGDGIVDLLVLITTGTIKERERVGEGRRRGRKEEEKEKEGGRREEEEGGGRGYFSYLYSSASVVKGIRKPVVHLF